jgi:PAS domain S-box-containing protein
MKDVIYTLDTEGNVTSINKAGKVTFGRETEEVLGKSFTKWIPEEQLPNTMAIFKRILRGEKVTAETVMLDKNGMPHNIEFSSTAIIKDGKVVGTRGIIRDITKRKKAEDELRKSRERIARAEQMASIGTLSASMVHKLTQPLMIITLSIERALAKLEKPSCTEAVKEVLKDAFSGVSRIVSIVSGFRDYGEKFPTKIAKEVNLKTIADRIVRLLSDSAHRARIILNINCLDKLPTIHAVEEDMEQLFFALTENAIQAADGKKKRHLVISGSLRDQHLELEFSDDCGGIALENLDRIFEPFFTTKPPGKGTGMGLCIVKDIVSRAGGQIRVESIPAKGSTFFVSLPINENKEG